MPATWPRSVLEAALEGAAVLLNLGKSCFFQIICQASKEAGVVGGGEWKNTVIWNSREADNLAEFSHRGSATST